MTILFKPDNIFLLLDGKLGFVTAWGCREITALEVGKNAGMSHSVLFYQDGLRGIYTSLSPNLLSFSLHQSPANDQRGGWE